MSLTQAQFAARLRAKIETRAAFDALLIEAYSDNAYYIPKDGAKPGTDNSTYRFMSLKPAGVVPLSILPYDPTSGNNVPYGASRWWAVREILRFAHGVYNENEGGLQRIAQYIPQMFVHSSTEDPTMVAYTPDPESGEKDRQLATTLSKFCRRFWPVLSDDRIRDIEAEYRALATAEIEFLAGKDIIEAYSASAVSACMSKTAGSYSAGGVHPTAIYDAPGVACAISRDANGRINGRTMTYVNPDDANDKRYIRVYGDPALAARLKRKGFRVGTWEGVKLRLINVKDSKTRFVAPYLDGNGQGAHTYWSSVVRAGGWLRVLKREELSKLEGYCSIPGTSGYIDLARDASAMFEFKCAIDGKEYKASETLALILQDGEVKRVYAGNIGEGWLGPFKTRFNNVWANCYVKERNVFEHKGDSYVELDSNREELDYVQLDAQRYASAACRWIEKSAAHCLPDGRWLKAEHCVNAVRWIDGKAEMSAIEIEDGQTPEAMIANGELVEVHRVGSARTFASRDVPFKVTRSGSKVVRGVHKDLRILPDDGLEFKRNVEIRIVMEVRWHSLVDTNTPLDVANIPRTNLLDRVFNDFAVYYMTQIPTARRDDRGGPWGPGTWNNFMNCWLHHNREYERVIPVMSPAGTHIIAGPWPALANYNPSSNVAMRQQYVDFARLCEKICEGSVEFADSVTAEQRRRFIEMARITRELRLRAARSLGAFPYSLTDDSIIGDAANPAATTGSQAAPAPAEPMTADRFLIAE